MQRPSLGSTSSAPRRWRRWRSNSALLLGLLAVLALTTFAVVTPWLRPDPAQVEIERGLSEQGAPLAPSWQAPLGTDDLGRDLLARVSCAARWSLGTAALGTGIALLIGIAIGLVAGGAGAADQRGASASPRASASSQLAMSGSLVDTTLMRATELVVAFPVTLLAILAVSIMRAASLESSGIALGVVLGLLGWPSTARVVRTKTSSLARSGFVAAARGLGASELRVALRHILPNATEVALVMASTTFAQILLAESVLSFAGLGAMPPAPSWGRMVFEGRIYYRSAPWLLLAPGLAIVVTMAAFHLVGEGLRRQVERAAP